MTSQHSAPGFPMMMRRLSPLAAAAVLTLVPALSLAQRVSGVGDVNGDGYEDYLRGSQYSVIGGAFQFDGVDDYAVISSIVADDPLANANKLGQVSSYSFWFYPTATGGTLVDINEASLAITASNQLTITSNGTATMTVPFSMMNRWNHILFDGQRFQYIVNGYLISASSDRQFEKLSPNLLIGAASSGDNSSIATRTSYFKGQIADFALTEPGPTGADDVFWYAMEAMRPRLESPRGARAIFRAVPGSTATIVENSVLSAPADRIFSVGSLTLGGGTAQILAARPAEPGLIDGELGAKAWFPFDATSGKTITEAITGKSATVTTATWSAGQVGNAVTSSAFTFSSTDLPNLPSQNSPYTISVWIKPSVANAGEIMRIGGSTLLTANQNGLLLRDNLLYNFWQGADLTVPFPAEYVGKWTHVVATYDGNSTKRRIYLNGVLAGEGQVSTRNEVPTDYSLFMMPAFSGAVDELAIFNYPVNAADTRRLMEQTAPRTLDTTADAYLELGGPTPARVNLKGAADRGRTGWSLSGVGDMNGDGLPDFAVGAPQADNGSTVDAGAVYLLYGSKTLTNGQTIDLTTLNGSNGCRIYGTEKGQGVGFSLSGAGDPNSDGVGDMIIGAPGTTVNGKICGAAYLIYGATGGIGSTGQFPINTIGGPLDKGISGSRLSISEETNGADATRRYQIGYSVSGAGDTNGDGFDDVLVGAPARMVGNTNVASVGPAGEVFLVYGKPFTEGQNGADNLGIGRNGVVDLAKMLDGTVLRGMEFRGVDGQAVGTSLSGTGDFDGDGYQDFLSGGTERGAIEPGAYLVYGNPSADATGAAKLQDSGVRLRATRSGINSAPSGAGDTNGDGYGDLVFGDTRLLMQSSNLSFADTINANILDHRFMSAVFSFRSPGPRPGTTSLGLPNGRPEFLDGAPGVGFGFDVSSAGDFNGDGISDIVAGRLTGGASLLPSATVTTGSATYRNRIPDGFGQLLGELQIWKELSERPLGTLGDGSHSIPLSRISVAFKGGGQGGVARISNQTAVVYRNAPPKPYVFDLGGPNQRPFKSAPMYWKLDTDRRRFSESTITFHVPGTYLAGLTQLERQTLGVFYTTVDPASAGAKSGDWVPLVDARLDATGTRLILKRTHDSSAGFPSPSETAFDGYYALFAGDASYLMGTEVTAPAGVDVSKLPATGPIVSPIGAAWWHKGQRRLFALKPTSTVLIDWIDDTHPQKASQAKSLASFVWPGNATDPFATVNDTIFDRYVIGAPPVALDVASDGEAKIESVQLAATETNADSSKVEGERRFSATTGGRTLLMLSDGDPQIDNIYFSFVWSVPFSSSARFSGTASVGQSLTAAGVTAGFHDLDFGAPWFRNTVGYICTDTGYYNPAAFPNTGPIVPVNVDLTGSTDVTDNFDLVYYKRAKNLKNGLTGAVTTAFKLYLPHKPASFTISWPASPAEITLSSGIGTGALTPDRYENPVLYYQNVRVSDPDGRPGTGDEVRQWGYNPNEEHAVELQVGGFTSVFPLRNDLNATTTSDAYVLVKYKDPTNLQTPSIGVWKVNASTTFDHTSTPTTVGSLILPPNPLRTSLFPPCAETATGRRDGSYTENTTQVWTDKEGRNWAIAATAADDGNIDVTMRYFYQLRAEFFLPDAYKTALVGSGLYSSAANIRAGTCVPWLSNWKGTATQAKEPVAVKLRIKWPTRDSVPTLYFAETLVRPKRGLPSIEGQESVELLAQQAALGTPAKVSAQLIDPTRERSFTLTSAQITAIRSLQLAPAVAGRREFELLAPHIRRRLLYEEQSASQARLVWKGEYVRFITGEDMLLPNVMTTRERDQAKAISTKADWLAAIDGIYAATSSLISIPSSSTPFSTLAVSTANATGPGFVTIGFNNKKEAVGAVSLAVIYVDKALWKGEAKVIYPDCPFVEEVSLRHNGDFAGTSGNYDFDWYYIDSARYFSLRSSLGTDPFPPGDPRWGVNGAPANPWVRLITDVTKQRGAIDVTVNQRSVGNEGVLSDLFWTVKYTSRDSTSIVNGVTSDLTPVALTEGWVKRVIGDFGPLRQRATGGGIQGAEDSFEDFRNRTVNTLVSMIGQAGRRWEGAVPLTCNNVDGLGLIEVYQTVMNRARALSIAASPPAVASDAVVDSLLLAASRNADLYALLGNEAFADATDPTLVFGTEDGTAAFNSSIHPFMNQVPTVLEEELGLLRGRDASMLPPVSTSPFYNRFVWNFTTDSVGGDVAYALNYAITDINTDGAIDEGDAAKLYPQGHGDAWGHLLSGLTSYYTLIRSPEFIWVPRKEAVLVGGSPVEVDFYDERKFAQLAAAKARVGRETVNLTYRGSYTEDPGGQWQGYKDTNTDRAWGVAEWGARASMGARLDWITANALLPADNGTTNLRDISEVNRATVSELGEISSNFEAIQRQVDMADAGMNPLGVPHDVVPFDISPAELEDGVTHFEQVYNRAAAAMANAQSVFDFAQAAAINLRAQADSVADFQQGVSDSEFDFESRLIELFGTPYPGDIGPTGSYPDGYNGPDIIHYMYVDRNSLADAGLVQNANSTVVEVTTKRGQLMAELTNGERFDWTNNLQTIPTTSAGQNVTIKYHLAEGFGLVPPVEWKTSRRVAGQLQISNLAVMTAMTEFKGKQAEYSAFLDDLDSAVRLFKTRYRIREEQVKITNDTNSQLNTLDNVLFSMRTAERTFADIRDVSSAALEGAGDSAPQAVGLATDIGAGIRSVTNSVNGIQTAVFTALSSSFGIAGDRIEVEQARIERNAGLKLQVADSNLEIQEALAELRSMILSESAMRLELFNLSQTVQQAVAEHSATMGAAERLIEERARFRRQTAAATQNYRHKDMAFRLFRNEAVQKYRGQFDLAARMVFLAAKAYDFESNMLGDEDDSGQNFLTEIVRTRALGRLGPDGAPVVAVASGDPGLSDIMARMNLNWQLVLKSQLGFNNPQTEDSKFSLRQELFRISGEEDSDESWREVLARPYGSGAASGVVENIFNIPAFKRYAIPFAGTTQAKEPAIVIRFGTNINFGQNFFVNLDTGEQGGFRLLGGGDSVYSSANFATKIRTAGIWFTNYNNVSGEGMTNTPIVYLFPTGVDKMRSPSGNRTTVRSFQVLDQAIPVPFPLSGNRLDDPSFNPTIDSLTDSFVTIRRFAPFRAFHDSGDVEAEIDQGELTANSRLIGRSAWNTEWYLVIPGGALHSDRYEGLHRFLYGKLLDPQPAAGTTPADGISIIRLDNGATEWRDGSGVSDIQLLFQTYAYEGI